MLIRCVLLTIALSACATTIETSETSQAGEAVCDVRTYGCDPLDPGAQGVGDIASRLPGSYCLGPTDAEHDGCGPHPDAFLRGNRYCDPWGLPAWNTFCVAGPIA
jgi:hypothetical protein